MESIFLKMVLGTSESVAKTFTLHAEGFQDVISITFNPGYGSLTQAPVAGRAFNTLMIAGDSNVISGLQRYPDRTRA